MSACRQTVSDWGSTPPTAQKIAGALRVPLGELLGPTPLQQKDQGCPVSAKGICLIDLIDHRPQVRSVDSVERYSPRQIRVMRRFTKLVREANEHKGFSVVIARHPCMLKFTRTNRKKRPDLKLPHIQIDPARNDPPTGTCRRWNIGPGCWRS